MFEDINIDFSNPKPFLLAAVGGFIAFFTASGGFAGGYNPPGGIFLKLVAAVIGAAVGFVWGLKTSE